MKINYMGREEGVTLARFGEARLVKKLDGKVELIGGSAENRTEAKEWVSLFLHEAVIARQHGTTRSSQPLA